MIDMLKDQVAIVTGGASGMGEATAKLYAKEGAKVVIADFNPVTAQKVVDEITAEGGIARFYQPMDVSDRAQVEAIVEKTVAEFGRIDILAAYAGKTYDGDPNLSQQECLEKTTAVNQWGTYYSCFAVVPQMKKQKSGKIIICSSNGAFNPTAPAYEYHMAKGACESLCINLAMDLAKFGIRVNCIKPGPIITAFWDELMEEGDERANMLKGIADIEVPLGRTGTADDIAGPALFFASELSSYVTGLCLYVAGGMGYVYAYNQSSIAHAGAGRHDI
ncbi:MAG TPA: SDR family oxidoreductase [Clostridiales bacterium]|nr:SDR family oxidoreductase [Clostridiales bacterium]